MTGSPSFSFGAFPLEVGESASSFVLRLANFLTVKPDGFLRALLGDERALASAIYQYGKVDFLCEASGLDRETLSAAFVRRRPDIAGEFAMLDYTLADRHIDQTTRRVSPVALARDVAASQAPYHRLVWCLRDLRFDPETSSPLISACDHCGRNLSWEDSFDPASCGRCGRPLWLAEAAETTKMPYDTLLCELFHPDDNVRSARRSALAAPLAGWSEGDLLDLLQTLRRIQRTIYIPSTAAGARTAEPALLIEASSTISEFLYEPLRIAAQSSDRTAVTAAAAAATAALMAAPGRVGPFLTSLMVHR
jgi:hypothetical protein